MASPTVDDPIRRVFEVAAPGPVGGLVPRRPGARWTFLRRRPDQPDYERIPPWQAVAPGDTVVAHLLDPTRPAELEAANAAYSAAWYGSAPVREAFAPWPDEREALTRWLPESGARVLETCCGSGRATSAAVRDGNTVIGLDIALPALAAARTDHPAIGWVQGDSRALPFPDRAFDAVLCLENSLGEFLVDPITPVVEMLRVCRDGGVVLLGLRDGEDPWLSWAPGGHVHVARTFPRPRIDALLGQLRATSPRPLRFSVREGDERPWGGRVTHLVVSPGGSAGASPAAAAR